MADPRPIIIKNKQIELMELEQDLRALKQARTNELAGVELQAQASKRTIIENYDPQIAAKMVEIQAKREEIKAVGR